MIEDYVVDVVNMNKLELNRQRRKVWYKYHIPGMSPIHRRKINAVFLNLASSYEHEITKCALCYELQARKMKYIVEAYKNSEKRRVDVVCLDTGIEYEIETDSLRASRFAKKEGVIVVKLWKYLTREIAIKEALKDG